MAAVIILVIIIFSINFVAVNKKHKHKTKTNQSLVIKRLSRTQKINLTRAELCAKRGVNRVPKNDVMWNVYQWEMVELLGQELWDDYRKLRIEMADFLIKEERYTQALHYYLEAQYIEKCRPDYLFKQSFSSRDSIFDIEINKGIYSKLVALIEICKLNELQVKEIFTTMQLAQIPFPITREEAWGIIAPQIIDYIEKYHPKYTEDYKKEVVQS